MEFPFSISPSKNPARPTVSTPAPGGGSPWLSFSWQAAGLRPIENLSPDVIRTAAREEWEGVLQIILTSLSMDSGWNDSLGSVEEYLRGAMRRLFNAADPLCLVVPKGKRIIAVSLLDPDADTGSHLVSGPAVLMEYRNRGVGTRLLHASIAALAERGISTVSGVTRAKTVAAGYVYPKFGGVASPTDFPRPGESQKGGGEANA